MRRCFPPSILLSIGLLAGCESSVTRPAQRSHTASGTKQLALDSDFQCSPKNRTCRGLQSGKTYTESEMKALDPKLAESLLPPNPSETVLGKDYSQVQATDSGSGTLSQTTVPVYTAPPTVPVTLPIDQDSGDGTLSGVSQTQGSGSLPATPDEDFTPFEGGNGSNSSLDDGVVFINPSDYVPTEVDWGEFF